MKRPWNDEWWNNLHPKHKKCLKDALKIVIESPDHDDLNGLFYDYIKNK